MGKGKKTWLSHVDQMKFVWQKFQRENNIYTKKITHSYNYAIIVTNKKVNMHLKRKSTIMFTVL